MALYRIRKDRLTKGKQDVCPHEWRRHFDWRDKTVWQCKICHKIETRNVNTSREPDTIN